MPYLSCVDVDGEICSVSHQVGIASVVLDQATSEDNPIIGRNKINKEE